MGFSLELYFLFRNGQADDDANVWIARGQPIDFGRVTRMEKITHQRFKHLEYDPHHRASICVVSLLLGKLFEKLDASPAETIAPTFLVYEFRDERDTLLETASGNAIEIEDWLPFDRTREQRKMREHNHVMKLPPDELRAHIEKHHPAMDPPFLWESAAVLARWLQEAIGAETDEWRELSKSLVSLALFRVWYAHLLELGKVDARVLFVFPH